MSPTSARRANVILLNGTSSAGKSTLARAIQDAMDVPYLHTGLDHFLQRYPRRFMGQLDGWDDALRDGRLVALPRVGPLGLRLFDGMYAAVAALARAGTHVVVDDVIHDARVLARAAERLRGLRALFVGVRCTLEELERRERERGDRTPGEARLFEAAVHAHGAYDLELDTSVLTASECAAAIKHRLEMGTRPTALTRLRERPAVP